MAWHVSAWAYWWGAFGAGAPSPREMFPATLMRVNVKARQLQASGRSETRHDRWHWTCAVPLVAILICIAFMTLQSHSRGHGNQLCIWRQPKINQIVFCLALCVLTAKMKISI